MGYKLALSSHLLSHDLILRRRSGVKSLKTDLESGLEYKGTILPWFRGTLHVSCNEEDVNSQQ